MDQLYIGLTRINYQVHITHCTFWPDYIATHLKAKEQLLSTYCYPIMEEVEKDLFEICHFAAQIGMTQTLLQLGEMASLRGIKLAIEDSKPAWYMRELSGEYIQGKFIPDFELDDELAKKFCRLCMAGDLSDEINKVIKLFYNTGRVLVDLAPQDQIIRPWKN